MIMTKPLEIDFLFWEECPSHGEAWKRLQDLLRELGAQAEINRIEIKNEAQAKRWRFCGSPTIRINGSDIDPEGAKVQPIGLNCRIYRKPDGSVTPIPPAELIRRALLNERK